MTYCTSLVRSFLETRSSSSKSKLKEIALHAEISAIDMHLAKFNDFLHVTSLRKNFSKGFSCNKGTFGPIILRAILKSLSLSIWISYLQVNLAGL